MCLQSCLVTQVSAFVACRSFTSSSLPPLSPPSPFPSPSVLSLAYCSVLWLLSCWMASISKELRPQLHACLGYCLRHPDKAIALTAANTLEQLVTDVNHEPAHLRECFASIVEGAFIAISTCEVTSAKLQLLELLADIMQRVGGVRFGS